MRAGLPDEPQRLAGCTPLAAAIVLAAGVAMAALAFAWGRGERSRRIHAEQQLDMVTETVMQARDLMRDAAPSPENVPEEQ
jgi:hypothetical protein